MATGEGAGACCAAMTGGETGVEAAAAAGGWMRASCVVYPTDPAGSPDPSKMMDKLSSPVCFEKLDLS